MYNMTKVLIKELEKEIEQVPLADQRRLLAKLQRRLKAAATDEAFLKLAEPSFAFWNNPADQIYDNL